MTAPERCPRCGCTELRERSTGYRCTHCQALVAKPGVDQAVQHSDAEDAS